VPTDLTGSVSTIASPAAEACQERANCSIEWKGMAKRRRKHLSDERAASGTNTKA
jgi:hypothetical protein